MPHDFMLKIRVSGEVYETIKAMVDDAGLTVSDYILLDLAHQRIFP